MSSVLAFVEAHPDLVSVVLWPLITALVTALFKPRSPEEYEAMPPRVAAGLKLLAALGVDPVKAVEAVKQLVSGKAEKVEPEKPDLELLKGGKE
jgi:hypothetical protein